MQWLCTVEIGLRIWR